MNNRELCENGFHCGGGCPSLDDDKDWCIRYNQPLQFYDFWIACNPCVNEPDSNKEKAK